jgi:homopolymeric O-antigen transport system ATP-binding protein
MAGKIVVEGVSKRFRHWEPNRAMTLQELVLRGFRWRRTDYFWALTDVSFEVTSGRMVGIMGFNGAGKSTLLRLVAGVGRPTTGEVKIHGRLGAMLELGVGFHPELTGRENIFISGVCSGLTRREVAARFDSIVAFSELEAFLDYPLRTYSTGMHVRLAFAVASHIEPEVLLIDEVLAVGDLAFQRKCMHRLISFKKSGCTGLLVSHAPQAVLDLCDDAIWLDHGRMVAYGPAEEVVGEYVEAAGANPKRPLAASVGSAVGVPDGPGAESITASGVVHERASDPS